MTGDRQIKDHKQATDNPPVQGLALEAGKESKPLTSQARADESINQKNQVAELVQRNLLPGLELDFTGAKKTTESDSPVSQSLHPNNGSDSPRPTAKDNGLDLKLKVGQEPKDGFSLNDAKAPGPDAVENIDAVAKYLVAAAKNPEQLQRFFQEGATQFSKDNPGVPGSFFSGLLNDSLKKIDGGQNFRSFSSGSEGLRNGNIDAILRQKDALGDFPKVAEANLKFKIDINQQDKDTIANKLEARLPAFTSELPDKNSLRQIVDNVNDLIVGNASGKDVKPIFEQAAAKFNKEYPTVSGTAYAALFQNAIELYPDKAVSTGLRVGFAGGDGRSSGSSSVYLQRTDVPDSKFPDRQSAVKVAEALMSFSK